jgi:AraC-like DNA-binding protein
MNPMQPELSLRDYGSSRGSHSHAHFQVLVGLDGVLELEVEGRGQRLGAGGGIVIPPGDRHDFESRAGSCCLVLDTADEAWRRCASAPACHEEVAALAHWLRLASQRRGAVPAQGADLLLAAWPLSIDNTLRARRPIDWPELSQWLHARMHEPLTVADLAAHVHLSASQFAQRCLQANGMSAMAWLRRQRLQRARQLRAAGLGVAEAARRCGYRSPSALTAAMRRALRDD